MLLCSAQCIRQVAVISVCICSITNDGYLIKVLSAKFIHLKVTLFPFVMYTYFVSCYCETM